jgi:hypothetical protein
MGARVASALALAAVWLVSTTHGPFSADVVNDLYVYSVAHDLLAGGHVPFRDFTFEYPPVALAPIAIAGGSQWGMSLLMLGCALVAQAACWTLGGATAGWLMVALPPVAGALVRTHFDLLPTALALVGLALVVRGRPSWGLAALAVGTMAKLWPAAIAVVAVAWLVGRGERRAAQRATVVFVAVVLAIGLPFALLGGFPETMVRFHLDRPVQIESTTASVLEILGGSHVTGLPVTLDGFKSNGLDGGAAGVVLVISTLALLACAAGLTALAARRRTTAGLVFAALGITLAFVALGKVLSPQYLCWLLPLAAVAAAYGARLAAELTAAAALVTQLWFPGHYFDVVFQHGWAVTAVAVRNALLLAALAATARALARSPQRAAAAPRPG